MRRLLLALSASAALAVTGLLLAGFVWPSTAEPAQLHVGPLHQLPVGEPRMIEIDSPVTRWETPPLMEEYWDIGFAVVAVVRHADDTVSAFLARDPRNGCPLAWRTDLSSSFGPGGFFRDPCHGSTYDEHGTRVFGPSPRYMDDFDVTVRNDGQVIVDLHELHEGFVPASSRWSDGTPTPVPTLKAQPTEPATSQ